MAMRNKCFEEFCYKGKRKYEGVGQRGMWDQERLFLQMKDVITCLFSDGNDPVEKVDNCRCDVEFARKDRIQCTKGGLALVSSMGGSYIAAEEKAVVGVVQGGGPCGGGSLCMFFSNCSFFTQLNRKLYHHLVGRMGKSLRKVDVVKQLFRRERVNGLGNAVGSQVKLRAHSNFAVINLEG